MHFGQRFTRGIDKLKDIHIDTLTRRHTHSLCKLSHKTQLTLTCLVIISMRKDNDIFY